MVIHAPEEEEVTSLQQMTVKLLEPGDRLTAFILVFKFLSLIVLSVFLTEVPLDTLLLLHSSHHYRKHNTAHNTSINIGPVYIHICQLLLRLLSTQCQIKFCVVLYP